MSWNAKRYLDRPSKHHRKPASTGGGNGSNVSEIPRSKHMAWHILFQNWDAYRIAEEINTRFLDPEFEFVVVHKKFKRGERE